MISLPMQVDQTLVPLPEEVVDHYLTILGVVQREPSLEALRELLAVHLTRIPFENISKLYYRKHQVSRVFRLWSPESSRYPSYDIFTAITCKRFHLLN
jgi:hypothetical protein